ncbi:ABC transporter substrate-binding protein [Vineibacter terrae]|uniref:ABC transporter substrate-binding protein n=1 Tax=Vineibacter terrae TaxID=2586908 RepID=UPI001C49834C|nr:ABC transporter substrate-binding protein [Vineibacter terrae]
MLKRLYRAVIGGLATAAVAWPLSLSAQAPSTLRMVMHSDLKVIDPIWVSAQIARTHGYLVYDTLYALDANLKPQPQMVAGHTVSPDGLVYTFTLRDGLQWHDGKPVTAEDCVQSIKRWAERDGIGQRLMQNTQELVPVDARTFRLTLKGPYGLVIESLAKPGSTAPFMMPKRIADTPGTQQIRDATGSGPFIFKADEWKPGDKVVYVRNANYKPRAEPPSGLAGGKVAKVDRIEWIVMPDPQVAANAMLAGEIDGNEALTPDLLPLVEGDKSIVLMRGTYPGQYTFRLNWLHPPFDNPKIREAVGYAIDQKPFLEAQVGDPRFYQLCKAYFICGTPLATTAGTEGRLEGNVAKAKALLQEAGYDGTPVVLMRPTDLPFLVNLAPVAKAQLERAGFKVDMQSMDWQTLVSRTNRREPPAQGGWNAFATSWGALDSSDPVISQNLNASCEKATPGWPCDKQIEDLRAAFARQTDMEQRKKIAAEIQARAVMLGTHYPLGEWYGVLAYSSKTKGWLPPMSATIFWNVEKSGP